MTKLVSCEIKERIDPNRRKPQLTNPKAFLIQQSKLVSCEIKE